MGHCAGLCSLVDRLYHGVTVSNMLLVAWHACINISQVVKHRPIYIYIHPEKVSSVQQFKARSFIAYESTLFTANLFNTTCSKWCNMICLWFYQRHWGYLKKKNTGLQSDFQSKAEYACMSSVPLLVGRDIKRGFGVGRNIINSIWILSCLTLIIGSKKKLSLHDIILLWSLKFWRSKA